MNRSDLEDDRRLESALADAVKAFPAAPGLKETVHRRLFGTRVSSAIPRRARRWRWFTAAAVCLLVVGGAWLLWPATPWTNVAYAELEALIEKSGEAEWAHYREGDREIWESYRPKRHYERSPGRVWVLDEAINRKYDYNAKKNTLRIRFASPKDGVHRNFADFIHSKIDHLQTSGKKVARRTETLDGSEVIVYAVSGFREPGELRYYIDPRTDRVVAIEKKGSGWLSWFKQRIDIDYPAEGPKDVYALGVPRDAKILDETPPREVLELVERLEKARLAGPKRFFRANIEVCESFSEKIPPKRGIDIELFYVSDGRVRRERYAGVPCPRPLTPRQAAEYLEKPRKESPAESLDQLDAWLAGRKPTQILFADSRTGRIICYSLSGEGKLETRTSQSVPIAEAIAEPAVWGGRVALDGRTSLLPEKQGPWGKLVGIENRDGHCESQRWRFNPDRDCLCEQVEKTWRADHVDVTDVLDYAKTPGDRWFQKQLRRSTHSGRESILITCFLDDRRDINPSLFDDSQISPEDLCEWKDIH